MTLDDLIARTAASLERQIEKAISHDELLLADKGASEDEIAAHVAIRREEGASWKSKCLSEIRRGLTQLDAPSARLQ
ncbi:hypothetical protein U8P80_03005 [Rhizobium beringeri]|jgi:hypothetical protein|uniref:Phenylalanine--tRNA ligase subunit alpha n=1 Tax=Rhizobium beringeri TaxID=3019934 RepID=A0ABY1XP95_9HYPH|nr:MULTISPECIES: hypothetical protein [Rhizobium]MBY5458052.1 hypothetical protein [Rhizobium leguminosarum]TBC71510.1 hypothetical protein ELH27_00875 [Rhizobium leguminosarum]TBE69428.1 hypothetical protein ELH03_00875 [Rhizobium beringeri]WSG74802.1 hypothetical protein U8P80_03005 [Rhizobium beringeri]WSH14997.1 hypothetical protein U8P74_03005 [Rhizobium beringeri]